jgi:hypothetical protein
LHKSTHVSINKKVFFPQLKDVGEMAVGETREIYIPVFKPVDAGRIVAIREGRMSGKWKMIKNPPKDMKTR